MVKYKRYKSIRTIGILLPFSTMPACNNTKVSQGFVMVDHQAIVDDMAKEIANRKKQDEDLLQDYDYVEQTPLELDIASYNIKNNATEHATEAFIKCDYLPDYATTPYTLIDKSINEKKFHDFCRLGEEELLAHKWVYDGTLANQKEITLPNNRTYDVRRIEVNHPGIVGFILTSKDIENPDIRIVFRGTKCADSIRRDLDIFPSCSPGYATYVSNAPRIIQQIKDCLVAYAGKKLPVSISGHSLGGADVQYTVHALIKDMAAENDVKFYECINKISIYIFNSPGVLKRVVKKTNKLLKQIRKKGIDIPIVLNNVLVDGDAVQCAGEATIFDRANPKLVSVNLYKVREHEPGSKGTLQKVANLANAHRGKLLIEDNKQKNYKFDCLSNTSADDAKTIHKENATKSILLRKLTRLWKKWFGGNNHTKGKKSS